MRRDQRKPSRLLWFCLGVIAVEVFGNEVVNAALLVVALLMVVNLWVELDLVAEEKSRRRMRDDGGGRGR